MPPTPTEHVLLARVARSYYLDNRSKSEIADEIGLSRFRVARLLDTARRDGVVRISIESPPGIDADLSVRLQQRFGLAHAVVVNCDDHDLEALREELGRVTGEVLQGIVTKDDVLGLSWARSLLGVGNSGARLAPCPVVQLTGALSGPDGSDVLQLVRRVARESGGIPHVFYAPLIAPDAATARALRRQPEVERASALADRVTVAVVGIGAWQPGLSTIYDAVSPVDRERAAELGTIGEVSGALFDATGTVVDTPLGRRLIGITGERLSRIDTVLSVAYGAQKADAVLTALTGGLVTGLITHAGLAQALLDRDTRSAEGGHRAETG